MADRSDQHQEKVGLLVRLKTNQLGWRLLVGILLTFFLALFLHFREVRMEMLELDTTAKNYVVAQVDFEFNDEESTFLQRQEAVRDAGVIYRVDDSEIDERFEAIIKNFESQALDQADLEMLHETTRAVEDALKKARFTDNRTLQKMRSLNLSTSNYYLFTPQSVNVPLTLPGSFWRELTSRVIQEKKLTSQHIDATVQAMRSDTWMLEEDTSAQRHLHHVIGRSISPKASKVRAGSRIIDQGEKVTMRHMAMMQGMKNALAERRNILEPLTIIGSILFAAVIVTLGAIYLRIFHRNVYKSFQQIAIFATICIATLAFAKATEYFLLETSHHLIEIVRYPLFIPFAAILICILIDHHVALIAVLFLGVVLAVTLAVDHNRFLILNVVAGIVSIIATRGVRKRKEVFVVCGKVWIACIPVLIAFNLNRNLSWDIPIGADFVSTLCFMIIIAVLVVGFLPILESIFRVMTDITLIEYMDPSNELLRRLSIEAPGTYQHSLVVSFMAESAAQAIGANSLLCRAAAQYHDVGKLFNPHYFTENQMGGFNIHQLLTPTESAQVIIKHVEEGLALARKHNLPKSFQDVIREHHGTTLTYYFYSKQVELMGGNVDAVDEKQFRYPGPKPRSKESAIIMIADSSEAAAKSSEDHSDEALSDLVDRIVADKAEEGQFDECKLTYEEVGIVKQTILKYLEAMYHGRVAQPEKRKL